MGIYNRWFTEWQSHECISIHNSSINLNSFIFRHVVEHQFLTEIHIQSHKEMRTKAKHGTVSAFHVKQLLYSICCIYLDSSVSKCSNVSKIPWYSSILLALDKYITKSSYFLLAIKQFPFSSSVNICSNNQHRGSSSNSSGPITIAEPQLMGLCGLWTNNNLAI